MTAVAAPNLSDDRIRLRVLDAIRDLKGPFTIPDLVAKTGLPPYQAEAALTQVVKDYQSDIDVDEQGNLVYRFDDSLSARPDIVKADAGRRRKEALKRGLIAFFKAWTVAMVVIYFLIYVALMIAFFVAMSQSRRDDNRSSSRGRGGGFGGGNLWLWSWGGMWGSSGYGSSSSWRARRDTRRWNEETEGKLRRGEDPYVMNQQAPLEKPSLKERTWYHLFGAKGIEQNPLEREKELLTYLRAKKGFITNADIIALLGVTYEEADQIGTRLVATYDGEMDLTDDAIAIYRFPNLMLTGAPEVADQPARLGYVWQALRKEKALRDNPSQAIPIVNGINIVLAFATYFMFMPKLHITGVAATIGLVVFPLLFSFVFLALGLMRKAREAKNQSKFDRDVVRAAMMQLLFTRRTAVKIPGDAAALERSGLGEISMAKMKELAPAIARELRGEAVEVAGGLVIQTPRLLAELATVDKLRASATSAKKVGKTVFTTRDLPNTNLAGDVVEPGQPERKDEALAAEIASLEKELAE